MTDRMKTYYVIKRKGRDMWVTNPNLWTYCYDVATLFESVESAQEYIDRNDIKEEGIIEEIRY